ncbi:MAG: hypothetical protein HYT29_01610 [Parcubacteria group bacterium]|nr:hypothetical protein [Parcubacteria group bacterium]
MARKAILFFIFVLVVGGGYAFYHFWSSPGAISPDFNESRLQGALIAQNIVTLSNQSALDLSKIGELDRSGKFTEALNLTADAVRQSQEIRDQAVALSSETERMTKSLSSIDSFEARQAVLESIANRLALISRLINYSGYLGQLLDVLHNRFNGKFSKGQAAQISNLVESINGEVRAINNFNQQASQAMDRFDKTVNR